MLRFFRYQRLVLLVLALGLAACADGITVTPPDVDRDNDYSMDY